MQSGVSLEGRLGELAEPVQAALSRIQAERVVARIWSGDHTVWKPEPREITNRLGWLRAPTLMEPHWDEIHEFAQEIRGSGFQRAVLLGMGGSSLAPEVLSRMCPQRDGLLTVTVLDTTHPDAIARIRDSLDFAKTLFIVSTKSGGTVETLSLFKYFYRQVSALLGPHKAGDHFCAITDPGSGLETLARSLRFRKIFQNDPNVGGRYSALTFFGLVPAALMGFDGRSILERAEAMAERCRGENGRAQGGNPGLWLGTVLGTAALHGQDKLTLWTDAAFGNLGDWVEQLIAESTGKEGKGIVPVVDEPVGETAAYGPDRLIVLTGVGKDRGGARPLDWGSDFFGAGIPQVRVQTEGPQEVGALFFLWEFATVVAGHLLEINPFDQPNVESAKVQAKKMLAEYSASGRLPHVPTALQWRNVDVIGHAAGSTVREAFHAFVDAVPAAGYIGVHAYVAPSAEVTASLRELQKTLRDRTQKAVTVGYGPRFLHSTGQLHKGDGGKGVFIQITDEPQTDLPIPDDPGGETSTVTFGTLIAAQALGDREALLAAGRPVLRLHIRGDVAQTVRALAQEI